MSENEKSGPSNASVHPVVMLPNDFGHCVGVIALTDGNRICPFARSCRRYLSHRVKQDAGKHVGRITYIFPMVNDKGGCDSYMPTT